MRVCEATRERIRELCEEKRMTEYMLIYKAGMPPSTVKVRLHRGRKKLKELLMERGYSCACADD